MTVHVDGKIIHFGEFLRSRVVERGRTNEMASLARINPATLYRFFRSPDPGPLNIEPYNKAAAARVAGFDSWDELDAAWRVTPVAPVPRRRRPPGLADRVYVGRDDPSRADPDDPHNLASITGEGILKVPDEVLVKVVDLIAEEFERRNREAEIALKVRKKK